MSASTVGIRGRVPKGSALRERPSLGSIATECQKPSRAKYSVVNCLSKHIQSGAMIGTSPETSVVKRYLQHWDLPDLFVVGASAYPQNPSQNPTLTAVALTTWVADAIVGRYLNNPGKLL